tara:strand:+ start:1325 stop:1606 length:282 start_codon:yes stop_codon:yes gene_type:complete
MAKILNVSVNVEKINKAKLIKGKKGTYLSLNIAINDEKDQFENDCSVWENQSKEEREAKADKNYLGNGKIIWSNDPEATQKAQEVEEDDDLPF